MNSNFVRAKSLENKEIRMHQIMDVTDKLFHTMTYHEITLSVISNETQITRGGLYKYVSSKEEIFLMIYLNKQKVMIDDLISQLSDNEINIQMLSEIFSKTAYKHLDLFKYHQILNAIIETNVSIEKLAEFKLTTQKDINDLLKIIMNVANVNRSKAFDIYLTIMYHCVYLYARVNYHNNYVQAMALAKLDIQPCDFVKDLKAYIEVILEASQS